MFNKEQQDYLVQVLISVAESNDSRVEDADDDEEAQMYLNDAADCRSAAAKIAQNAAVDFVRAVIGTFDTSVREDIYYWIEEEDGREDIIEHLFAKDAE